MNYILLLQSYGSASTRRIAEKMTEPVQRIVRAVEGGWELRDSENKAHEIPSILKILNDSSSRIINWGNYIFSDDSLFDLNFPSSVALASNKRRTRRVLQDAGIAVPKSYFWENLEECKEVNYPIIVRPSHHSKGKDFHVFHDAESLTVFLWGKTDWYAAEVFEKTHEFRVYVGHGKILMIHNKPLIPGEIRANYAVNQETWPIIRWSEYNEKVCLESIKAVETLGLDYGAVDIMYNEKNDSVAIAEVNTSPQITTEYTSGKFAEYFSWVIRHNFPLHFKPDGTSVFYNKILRS